MAENLDHLRQQWLGCWPAALAAWSPFIKLSQPRFCTTRAEEKKEQLSGSFAMIRLVDHAIVVSLRLVHERGLVDLATEILAHEIGHHVYCPADLTDNARLLARTRAGLPSRERLAGFIANLYTDLLINDRLQRSAGLNLAGVYRRLAGGQGSRLWTLYMRIYESLWQLERGELAGGTIDQRLNIDAQLGARLVRSYAKDWLDGAGRFAMLCLPYLLEESDEACRACLGGWHDTECAGSGGLPDGLAEIDEAELEGAIHPAEDPELSGLPSDDPTADRSLGSDEKEFERANPRGRAKRGGHKSIKRYREPFEYSQVLRASGVTADERELVSRYYRERALPHVVPFPSRNVPQAVDPQPEGTEMWDVGSPLESIDWLATVLESPIVIPGVTTRERLYGTSPGNSPERVPVDLYLGVDCSGSMGNPAHALSYPVLAGAIVALSALRAGSRVMVALSGEPGSTVTTDGFVRDESAVLAMLTGYLGTGYSFGIHRLRDVFENRPQGLREVHILIVSDNDMFSMLDQRIDRQLGWDVASESVARARGGGTYVLQLPAHARWEQNLNRMRGDAWQVSLVTSQEELVEFARAFAQANYARLQSFPPLQRGD